MMLIFNPFKPSYANCKVGSYAFLFVCPSVLPSIGITGQKITRKNSYLESLTYLITMTVLPTMDQT